MGATNKSFRHEAMWSRTYSQLDQQSQRQNAAMDEKLFEINEAYVFGFSSDEVNMFEIELKRPGGSPTDAMLTILDHRNFTIAELFKNLHKIGHARGMLILRSSVDPSLHGMIDEVKAQPLSPSYDTAHQERLYVNIPHKGDQGMMKSSMHSSYLSPSQISSQGMDPSYHHYSRDSRIPPSYITATHLRANYPPYHVTGQPLPGSPHDQMAHNRYPSDHLNPPFRMYQSTPSPDKRMGNHPADPRLETLHSFENNLLGNSEEKMLLSPKIGHDGNDFLLQRHHSSDSSQSPDASVEKFDKMRRQNEKNEIAMKATLRKTYQEIADATDNFSDKFKIGEGSFGTVFLAEMNLTKYAVKILKQNDYIGFQNKHRSDQIKELTALTNYKHKNIVLLCFFSIDNQRSPCLIYEYLENGSLEDNLQCKNGRKPLPWKQRIRIAEGAALGINHLHTGKRSEPLIHGDIKSANILLDRNFEPKIADFGLARPGPTNGRSKTILKTEIAHGTLPYLPPEFKRNFFLSTKVDIYSFGVVMMEIFTGRRASDNRHVPPILLTDEVEVLERIPTDQKPKAVLDMRDKKCSDWPVDIAYTFVNLAIQCLNEIHKKRPEMAQVVHQLRSMNCAEKVDTSEEQICQVHSTDGKELEKKVVIPELDSPEENATYEPEQKVLDQTIQKDHFQDVSHESSHHHGKAVNTGRALSPGSYLPQERIPKEWTQSDISYNRRFSPPNMNKINESFPDAMLISSRAGAHLSHTPPDVYSYRQGPDGVQRVAHGVQQVPYRVQSSEVSSSSSAKQNDQKHRDEIIFQEGYRHGLAERERAERERSIQYSRFPQGVPIPNSDPHSFHPSYVYRHGDSFETFQYPSASMDYSYRSEDIRWPPNVVAASNRPTRPVLPMQKKLELDTEVLKREEAARMKDMETRARDELVNQPFSLQEWRTRQGPEQMTEPLIVTQPIQ